MTCPGVHVSPAGLEDVFLHLMGRLDNVRPAREGTAWATQLGEAVEDTSRRVSGQGWYWSEGTAWWLGTGHSPAGRRPSHNSTFTTLS